jgi:hypothetical protein
MATVRVFAKQDVPGAAALFARVYPEQRWNSQAACEAYFREMLFDNPWRELDLPSWVAEEDGRIVGCYAILPRPMLFRGHPIRVAVGCQFMVDPDKRHSLTSLQLAKACLSGPQDLTLADGATNHIRRAWIGIGGTASPLYSLHWTRLLRPVRHITSVLEERAGLPRSLALAMRPMGAVVDILAARMHPNRFYRQASDIAEGALDAATMLSHLPDVLHGYALRPLYEDRSLPWLLEQAARKTQQGKLRARSVRDGRRGLIGWYMYYLQAGGMSEVVQIAASHGSFDRVLRQLLADAWRHGAAAVRGRLDPCFVQEYSDQHCWSRTDGTWTLVHSRHPEVMAAIHRGDAFLSRLEGEWWLRFLDGEGTVSSAHRAGPGAPRPAFSKSSSSAWTQA